MRSPYKSEDEKTTYDGLIICDVNLQMR